MGKRLLQVCLCLLLAASAWGQQAEDNWLEETIESRRTMGWFSEDPIGEKLAAPQLELISEEEQQPPEDLSVRLSKVSTRLSLLDSYLNGIAARLEEHKDAARQRRSYLNQHSEVRGTVEWSPGNGGEPNIYNALRLRPLLDKDTRLGIMLYMRNGIGTDRFYQLSVNADEFYLATKVNWLNQTYDLRIGNYYMTRTPFTLFKNYRVEDLNVNTQISLHGVRAQGRLFGLNWLGFLARIRDGKHGTAFDRFLVYNHASTPIEGGQVGLALMRTFDDLGASNLTEGAYSSTTIGLTGNWRHSLLGANFSIEGEANLNRTDEDVTGGPWAGTNHAVRLAGSWNLKAPLSFNFWSISKHYPLTNTAIQELSEDYIYVYQENPWAHPYMSNSRHFDVAVSRLPLGKFGELAAKAEWNRQLETLLDAPLEFGYAGGTLTLNPWDFLSLPVLRGFSVQTDLGAYRTLRGEDFAYSQDRVEVSLNLPQFNAVNLSLGYECLLTEEEAAGANRELTRKAPFLRAVWAPTSGTTLNWRYEPKTLLETAAAGQGSQTGEESRHKLELRSTIGPRTSLIVRYEKLQGDSTSENMSVSYRTGF